MKKTVLITGASSGFGLLLATRLHDQGFEVIGTSRHPQNHAGRFPFKLLRLDVTDDASIKFFLEQLFANIPRVDVLINNAGYMLTGIAEETPVEAAREQFETNFWGTVKVTNALLPFMREKKGGQIITVSSIVGLIGPPNLSYYSASKHAVEGYFKSLRFELDPFNISVSMVEPVWFKTKLGVNAVASKGQQIAAYDQYRRRVDAATQKGLDEAQAPDAVVEKIIRLIGARKPPFRNPVGKMSGMIVFLQHHAPRMFESSILKSVASAR